MIIFMFFIAVEMIGCMLLFYGLFNEYSFYILVAQTVGLPQVPIPLGFYFIISAGIVFMALPIIMLVRVKSSGCSKRFDVTPRNKGLFDFIYRDGEIRDVYGDRIPGLGLYRIFKLGLIFDTGRKPEPGSVYNIPGKKLRFALQDINFNPNAKIAGFYPYLTNLGFNNMNEFQEVLQGYNHELMVKVWNNLIEQNMRIPADDIIDRVQNMNNKDIEMNNRLWNKDKDVRRLKYLKRKKNKKQDQGEKPPATPWGIMKQSMDTTKKDDVHTNIDDIINKRK